MTILIATAAFGAALLVSAAFAFAPRAEIVTEQWINASPERVWAVLVDGRSYKDWNPFIRDMKGVIEAGGRLENKMEPTPGKPMVFRPLVLVADSQKELRWLGRFLLPRIFDGEHYFLLEAVDGGTKLVHGERFRGVALWFMDTKPFETNFRDMNNALKAHAETD